MFLSTTNSNYIEFVSCWMCDIHSVFLRAPPWVTLSWHHRCYCCSIVMSCIENSTVISLVAKFKYFMNFDEWIAHVMMTSSNGYIFRVTGHLWGEFTGPGEFPAQRPVTRSFDLYFDLSLNKRLSKQLWGWWFETPPCPWWCHCNVQ